MKRRTVLFALLAGLWAIAEPARPQAAAAGPIKAILDTDFNVRPQGDGPALALALKSPELQILGITTVTGSNAMGQATAEALSELEIAGRSDIPVFMGANRPLVHQASEWIKSTHQGRWWSDDPVVAPPGGFAKTQAQKKSAVDFLVGTVNANPGQVTIIAIGPLTNIAIAIRQSPDFARNVKQLNIMGGAIGSLPNGKGNVTPSAEFNFWVDPEAAQVVLRSGIPISLTPLNLAGAHEASRHMTDELAVASVIDPGLVKVKDMYVDVDINHGLNYGASVGWLKPWDGGEGAKQVSVQYDVDYDRLIKLYADRLASYDSRVRDMLSDRTKK